MKSDPWAESTFGELIGEGVLQISDGYRAKNSELGGDGPIFLRAGHVTDSHIQFDGVDRFRAELTDRVLPKMSRPGDVVVTTKGNSTGRVTYVDDRMPRFVYSPHLSFWRSLDLDRLWPGFLRYWSRGREFEGQLAGMKTSTDMAPYLSLVDQKRLRISLPPIDQQREIAAILGSLDDKIDLNRRMNATLEAIARTLFRSWFVDFDPVRVEAADLAREGVLEIGDGYRAKNSELGEPGLPFIRAANLNNGFDLDRAEVLNQESVARAGSKIAQVGDVAFTSKGTIGRMARVGENSGPFVYSPQVCFWRSLDHDRLPPALLYNWMQSTDFLSQIDAVSGQTDMAPYVSLRDQRRVKVPLLPESRHRVAAAIEPLLKRQSLNMQKSRTLAVLRDTLLPKLLSGEVRVGQAEEVVEAPP